MSLKYEKIVFDPNKGVFEAISQNYMRDLGGKIEGNVAEVVLENLKAKSEQLVELHKFQCNLGIMGVARTSIFTKKGQEPDYRAFFIMHPHVPVQKNYWETLWGQYKPVLQKSLGIEGVEDPKAAKSAIEKLGKKNPKGMAAQFLLNLEQFPGENLTEFNAEAAQAFLDLATDLVKGEGDSFLCPFDGKKMTEMYEDKYGIKFCCEKCKNHYYLLVNNNIPRSYDLEFDFHFEPMTRKGERTTVNNWGGIMPNIPNICILCGNCKVFSDAEAVPVMNVHEEEIPLFNGKLTRMVKLFWTFGVCSDCRELISSVMPSMLNKKLKYKLRQTDLANCELKDLDKNCNMGMTGGLSALKKVAGPGMKYHPIAFRFETSNKFLAWEFFAYNHLLIQPEQFLNFLVSIADLNPKTAFDWLEHRYMRNWTDLYEKMLRTVPPSVANKFGNIAHL